MASVHDVAAAIVERVGSCSTMKLQKLVYYCQAWHLVWDEEPLFPDRIEAWAGGPVVRSLYEQHRGRFTVTAWPMGNSRNLSVSERETVEAVVGAYSHLSGQQLSVMTHREHPWRDARARAGLGPGERGDQEITREALQDYYAAVDQDPDARDVESLPTDLLSE
jgi:uncharacterized phage-associated protein